MDGLTSHRGIGFRSITEGLHTDGPMGKAMLTIMAAFAQLERDTMIERTRAGLAAAAAPTREKAGGRGRSMNPPPPRRAACETKALRPSTLQRCLGFRAPPSTATSQTSGWLPEVCVVLRLVAGGTSPTSTTVDAGRPRLPTCVSLAPTDLVGRTSPAGLHLRVRFGVTDEVPT